MSPISGMDFRYYVVMHTPLLSLHSFQDKLSRELIMLVNIGLSHLRAMSNLEFFVLCAEAGQVVRKVTLWLTLPILKLSYRICTSKALNGS